MWLALSLQCACPCSCGYIGEYVELSCVLSLPCIVLHLPCLCESSFVAFSFSQPNTQLQLQQLPLFGLVKLPLLGLVKLPLLGLVKLPLFWLVKLPLFGLLESTYTLLHGFLSPTVPTTSRQDFYPFRRLSLGNYISRFPPLDDVPFWTHG
jgi:hypothetical protein